MSSSVSINEWKAPGDGLPAAPQTGTIYVLPRMRDGDGGPAFSTETLTLVKGAANAGVSIDYALPPHSRRFVDHFSADVSTIDLWLAISGPITDVVLFGLGYVVDRLLHTRGSSRSDADAPTLRVRIAQYRTESETYEGFEAEGPPDGVIAAMEAMKHVP